MPHFTLPTSQDGLTLAVTVDIDPMRRSALMTSGQPLPTPVVTRGMLDPGSNVSVVASRIVAHLRPVLFGASTTQGVSGSAAVNLFEVSLRLMGLNVPGAPVLELSPCIVMEAPQALPGIEVLIGMDVLRKCLLLSDGPGQQFTLAF